MKKTADNGISNNTRDISILTEVLIDVHGMNAILELISDICCEKSEHLLTKLTNWQDKTSAK